MQEHQRTFFPGHSETLQGSRLCYDQRSDHQICMHSSGQKAMEDLSMQGNQTTVSGTISCVVSECPTTTLSQDLQLQFQPSQVLDNEERNRSSRVSPEHMGEDVYFTNGFSEEHLLNITFEACDTMGKGEVLASTIMNYLQDVTAQSPDQEQLIALRDLLDPEHRDPPVSRDMFHNIMSTWIAHCCQDSKPGENAALDVDCCKVPVDGVELSASEPETDFPETRERSPCDCGDLLNVLEDLKHTRQRLSEQNSSLLKIVTQCEDTNLHLIVEITHLRSKLTSAQRSVARAQVMSEELDETRRTLQESQEKATLAEANISKLRKENEYLKAHMKISEEANEKLSCEKISLEGLVSKLMKMHTDVREELCETLAALADKEKEATKKSLFIEDLKISNLENYNIIEGVQMELLQLQENLRRELLRFNGSSAVTPTSLERGGPGAQHRSLLAEIEEAQKQANMGEAGSPLCGIVSPHNPRTSEQILQQVLTKEFEEFGVMTVPDMNLIAGSLPEALEGAHLKCQQQQASIRKHLANVERELELQKLQHSKVEGQLAGALDQAREAKNIAAITWWRTLKVEENKTKAAEDVLHLEQVHTETTNRPQKAEGIIQELGEQLHHLEGALRTARQLVDEYRIVAGSELHELTENSEKHVEQDFQEENGKREQKDAAAVKDIEGDTQASTTKTGDAPDPASEILLISMRKAEDLPRWTCEAANLACLNDKSFSQTKVKLETASHMMEGALLGTTEAKVQLRRSEACMSVKSQPIGHSWPSGPGQSSLASSEPIIAGEQGLDPNCQTGTSGHNAEASNDAQLCFEAAQTDGASFGAAGRGTSNQDYPEADGGGFARLTDKPSSRLCFEEASRWSNGCHRCPPLAEASLPAPEERTAELGAPSSESNSVGISPHSHGPHPVTHSQNGTNHVGGQEDSVRSDTSKSEPPDNGGSHTVESHLLTLTRSAKVKEHCSQHIPPAEGDGHPKETTTTANPRLRSRGPAMPTLPEEEEDSPEELDSSSSSPVSFTPAGSRTVLPTPSIIIPGPADTDGQDPKLLKQARSQSPRPRLSRSSSGNPITTIDSSGHVIDLVKDTLPDIQLSEEDKKKNLELLGEAKKVSDRFLTRRGRRSTCSLSESPTGVSPNPTPRSSPVPSRNSSVTVPPQSDPADVTYGSPSAGQRLEVPGAKEQGDSSTKDPENSRKLVDWKATEKRKVSSGTLSPRCGPKEGQDPQQVGERGKKAPMATADRPAEQSAERGSPKVECPTTGVAKPVPRPSAQQAPCTAEIKTIGVFPPLMRAVSWEAAGCAAPSFSRKGEEACVPFEPAATNSSLKSSGYKDFPVQPVKMQKLAKIREEHKLIRNQSIGASKLPDLSESAEQDRASTMEEDCKEKLDVMPNIPDVMLRKLKLHRALPGGAPSLTEKEVENAFVQLSLAFRNDNYTLEMRLRHAERERNLTEENTEKELEEFKGCLKNSAMLWQNSEQREAYQRLLETVAVLHRLAIRLSSRAEMVGAVRQEKRMNKATEVMMQYVENLKRTYEKDHAELMEFKKLANQNSSRCYGGSMDNGDDGVPRSSRSMSLTLGKALPRRRVSVAVVPKFNLLNIPGQSPPNSGPGLPAVSEANSMKSNPPNEPTEQAAPESGRTTSNQEGEAPAVNKPSTPINPDEIISELKAKIEEDAYNKGYQEGLKRSKELQELKEEEEKAEKSQEGDKMQDLAQEKKCSSSRYEEAVDVLERMCPKMFRRNRIFWIALTLLGVAFFLVSVFTYFSDHYSERGDASTGKSVSPGKKKFFGWNVKNPAPE